MDTVLSVKKKMVRYVSDFVADFPMFSTLSAGITSVFFMYWALVGRFLSRKQLRSVVDRKQEDRKKQFENIRVLKKSQGDESQAILKLDWDKLVDQLQSRKLTAVQVLKAYQLKAVDASEFCNAVTEFNPKAMEMAEKLDKMTSVKGPLHGVPFCVKDDTNVEGMDSTLGCAKRCYQPAEASAVLVRALIDLGAVPFCKTNVPQTLLTYGSDNPVFGTTTSCHNKKLTAGGSSSGTGALVGSGGAMFGTGTDVGGSLRLPAHCNGTASIKPTAGRFSMKGVEGVIPNLMGLSAVSGIIGANPKVVGYVVRHLLIEGQLSQYDPLCLPIPWNEKVYSSKKPMRIGYFTGLEFFPPVGDTIEVVGRAVDALRAKGHTMVPISTLPDGKRMMRCASNFIMADGSRTVKKIFEGEEVAKSAELMSLATKAPTWALKFFKFLMERKTLLPWIYSDLLASVLDAGSTRSYELWENHGECKQIREEILAEWSKLELDCCLCPVMPFPAPPLHVPGYLPIGCIYTMMWNVVEFPAGVVRFGEESGKNIDSYDTRGDQALKLAQKSCKESIGSPICVQVVALPFKEEIVLRVMEELGESHP